MRDVLPQAEGIRSFSIFSRCPIEGQQFATNAADYFKSAIFFAPVRIRCAYVLDYVAPSPPLFLRCHDQTDLKEELRRPRALRH